MRPEWQGFFDGQWTDDIDVRSFVSGHYTPYDGDESFLVGPTARTTALWQQVVDLMKIEQERGIYDADEKVVSSITSHSPGYIDSELEQIVGLQTEKPLKRALMPYGGIRVVESALESYGRKLDPEVKHIFTKYRKTHNEGVFDAYTSVMRKARSAAIITGLPDAYGRGRIVGDYRRVALYGVDFLIQKKDADLALLEAEVMDEEVIRLREEISEQIKALKELKLMASQYGFDISVPASTAKEAIQWLYFGYLAAVKEQNGAAMSMGRVANFIDIYIERDLKAGVLNEEQAQELIDHFIMKLRMVRFLRTAEYNELFSGDPTWVTESLAGIGEDGRHLVTKTCYRILHTLYNLGSAPEPNITVLWSEALPDSFKKYCAWVSIEKSSIQYESDDAMRPYFGDDYCIACCVSAMRVGKQMQFFGARANLAKALLYTINGGRDEVSGKVVASGIEPITSDYLDYNEVMAKFDIFLEWLAQVYVNTLNVIHYMHDKYCYERIEMALHDTNVKRTCATGVAGLSVVADSLSAIKHAKVKVLRNEQGLAFDYEIEGDFPKYGNNDPQVDQLASDLVDRFMGKLRKQKTYRNSEPTLSILTITSNVVYGKKTGSTPDGRKKGEAFAPGANPLHGRDKKGAIASMASVAQLPYEDAMDGISYTFSVVPRALGKTKADQIDNLSGLIDGYFNDGGHHININVMEREMLMHAMEHPELYPQLTIRVSGYAVNFSKLNREQQLDVINRTFHSSL